jgi:myo-inositol-1(or 4)-monophosphatase
MKQIRLKSALTAAVKAARDAGKIMRANWHKPKRVNSSEAHDIKLELDVRCQKIIEKILRARFPEIPLLGEEGVSGDVDAAYRWVVDPIDGTVNYFYGMPHAAVSIALEHQKKSIVAVIYDPFTDEIWTSIKGAPTRLNGKIICVSNRSRIEESVVAMGFSKNKENLKKSLPHLIRISKRAKKIRILGSAALELAYVASGRLDAYIERTINLWDVAAGSLLVENAGGEFYTLPAPGGKLRMCADNGKLRKKLQIGSLLK